MGQPELPVRLRLPPEPELRFVPLDFDVELLFEVVVRLVPVDLAAVDLAPVAFEPDELFDPDDPFVPEAFEPDDVPLDPPELFVVPFDPLRDVDAEVEPFEPPDVERAFVEVLFVDEALDELPLEPERDADFELLPLERLRLGLSFPIGSALPTAFMAPPAAPPTVPAIFPAVRPTFLTTFPGSGIGSPPICPPLTGRSSAVHARRVPARSAGERAPRSGAPGHGAMRVWSRRRQPPTRGDSVNWSLRSILLLVAVILFVLAAFGISLGTVSLVPLGLAFFAGAFLLGDGGFNLRR